MTIHRHRNTYKNICMCMCTIYIAICMSVTVAMSILEFLLAFV